MKPRQAACFVFVVFLGVSLTSFSSFSSLVLIDPPAMAQLSDTQWMEQCMARVGTQTQNPSDPNPTGPDDIMADVQTGGGGVTARVEYPESGPPAVTASASGYVEIANTLEGEASGEVLFSIQIVLQASPPTVTEWVPFSVTTTGSATAGGSDEVFAVASANLVLMKNGTVMGRFGATARSPSGPFTASFDETENYLILPDTEVTGVIAAHANIDTHATIPATGNATATAMVDPVFEISSDPIPGDGRPFNQVYEIEYSPGYWSLGTTPVAPKTWGELKKLFSG